MPLQKPQPHILSYDIADPKRLLRVHRTMRRWGIPLQYSVFLVTLNHNGKKRLLAELAALIHAPEDDIRLYPLPASPEVRTLGVQQLAEGIELFDDGLGGGLELLQRRPAKT